MHANFQETRNTKKHVPQEKQKGLVKKHGEHKGVVSILKCLAVCD
jgi:hypothetical protein